MRPWREQVCAGALAMLLMVVGGGGRAEAQISPGDLSRAHEDLEGPLNCMTCHGGKAEEMDGNCLDCHGGIAELRRLERGLHARVDGKPCAACHPEHAGRDFALIAWDEGSPEKFDHRRAGWPLAGKHAKTKCRDCHRPEFQVSPVLAAAKRKDPAAGWLGLETECSACHRDPHRGVLGADCARCHGADAFKPATAFDHQATAYPLAGKHAEVECAKCHLAPGLDLVHDEDGRPLPLYKPLAHDECSACHRDPHEGRLGGACAKCHGVDGFTLAAAPGKFDHAATRYPLRGKHRSLECAACHDPERAWGKRPAFDRCDACHADAHAGAATLAGQSADCAACHDENAFARSTYTVARHAASDYPLAGKHAEAECRACHARRPAGVDPARLGTSGVLLRPAYDRCRDCHAEAHGDQLAGRPAWADCAACHDVEGFKPSRFGVAEHASLALPLAGRHEEVPCSACHGPKRAGLPPLPGPDRVGKAGVLLALDSAACTACHRDPHAGRFTSGAPAPVGASVRFEAAADSSGCADCHGADAFRPSRVDLDAHRRYAFALEGAHQAVPCFACHRELVHEPVASTLIAGDGPMPSIPFAEHRSACADCHEDPHGGQFATPALPEGCAACHGQEAFRPASRFDHDRDTDFTLRGAHAGTPCASCHEPETFPDGRTRVRYRPVPKDCRSCHRNLPSEGGSGPSSPVGGGRS